MPSPIELLASRHLGTSLRWKPRKDSSLLIPFVMRWIDRARRPIAATGVDFKRFREILELKLKLDTRGPGTGMGRFASASASGGSSSLVSGGLAIVMAFAWLAGLPAGILAVFKPDPVLWMAAVSATVLGLVGFILLAQYGPMLVDTTDIGVIAPRPVDDRTLFAARMAHVFVYVGLMAVCIGFWPLFLGSFGYPFWAVIALVPLVVLLSTLLAVGGIGLSYAIVLRVFGPARFQRFTFALQIAVMAVMMGGSQILPRLLAADTWMSVITGEGAWSYVLPPNHFGGLFALVIGQASSHNVSLAILALVLPLASLALAMRIASRHFIAGLAGEIAPIERGRPSWRSGTFARLGRFFAHTREERAGYEMALALSRRDKIFLRGAWPQLISFSLMVIAMSVPFRGRHHSANMSEFAPFGMYLMAATLAAVLEISRYSEHGGARWLFEALPIARPGRVLSGGVKGLLFGSYVPVMLTLAILLCLIAGFERVPDVVTACEWLAVIVLGSTAFLSLEIPFTREPRPGELRVRNIGVMFALMGCAAVAAVTHALARLHPIAQGALMVLLVPVIGVAYRRLQRLEVAHPEGRSPARRRPDRLRAP